jgi:hypothetical protein
MAYTTHHHWHPVGVYREEGECCICSTSPCGAVTVEAAVAHERGELSQQKEFYETEVEYALAHGRRPEAAF